MNGKRIAWPGGAPYAVALTFDLDRIRPTYHRLLRRLPAGAFWNFHHIEEMLERFDATATLFVLDQQNPLPLLLAGRIPDAFGVFSIETVAAPLRSLHARGVEIGIHGAWGSRDRALLLLRQRRRLAKELGVPLAEIRGNRQHYLDHVGAVTFRAEKAAGLSYDASVGSNSRNGFADGGYHPWRTSEGLVEIPMAAMDTALLWESRDTGEAPLEIAASVRDAARDAGGVFQVCIHPHHFRPGEFSHELGAMTLDRARSDGAWVTTLGRIAELAP